VIKANKIILGRPIAKGLKQIINKDQINVGYGFGQLRPNKARDIRAECRQLAIIIMDINGMSGQKAG